MSSSNVESLELDGISFAYGNRPILDGISLDVRARSLFALLGPSGSGKSTLLNIVAGLLPPDRGRVILGGEDITALAPERRRIGFVFQSYALFPSMNARDNIAFGARQQGMAREAARRWAEEVAAGVDLASVLDHSPDQLSGGQQQRVALARAVAMRPRLLLLDEPLSNIDPALRVRVRAQLRDWLHRWEITTVLVTHDREDAFWLADELGVLQEGRLVQTGPPQEVYRRPVDVHAAQILGPVSRIAVDPGDRDRGVETPEAGPGWALLRPEDVEFRLDSPTTRTAARRAVVEEIILLGAETRLRCRLEDGAVVWASRFVDEPRPGTRGWVVLPLDPWIVPATGNHEPA